MIHNKINHCESNKSNQSQQQKEESDMINVEYLNIVYLERIVLIIRIVVDANQSKYVLSQILISINLSS